MAKTTRGDGFTFIDLTPEARKFVGEYAAEVAEAGAIMVRDEVVKTIESGTPTGERYLIPGTGARYRASAPGEPPAIREGRYRESWDWTPAVEDVDGSFVATAFTDLLVGEHVLGEILEFGTVHMKPRPHVRQSVDRAQVRLRRLIEDASK